MKWILAASMFLSGVVGFELAEARSEKVSVISDTVKKVREDDEGVVILFVKSSGAYYLRRDVPGFGSYRKKLEDSLSKKKPVSVTAEEAQLNILEVK